MGEGRGQGLQGKGSGRTVEMEEQVRVASVHFRMVVSANEKRIQMTWNEEFSMYV